MKQKVLTLNDYDFLTYAVFKFIKQYHRISKGHLFDHTYEEVFHVNGLICRIIRQYFEFGDIQDVVFEHLFKLLPSEKDWPYKVKREEFVNFIYNIRDDYDKSMGERK